MIFLKNKNEQYKKLLRALFVILLLAAEALIFAFVWISEYNEYIVVPFVQKGNWFFYLFYSVLLLIFLNSFDSLKFGIYRRTNLITAQILATLATAFIIYFQIVLLAAKFVTPVPLLMMILADSVAITAITFSANFLMKKIFPAKKTILIYESYSPEVFLEKVKLRKDKFAVDEVAHVDVGMAKLEESIKNYDCVIIYDVHAEHRNKILKICFENNIRAYTTTKVSDILIRGAESLHIFDTPLLLYRNVGLTIEQRIMKRAFDIVVSLVLLILTSPLLLLSALAIKLYDGGPVFFYQDRNTMGGKVFRIHKFRSMIVNAESDGVARLAKANDSRITPLGNILRRFRLDELQFGRNYEAK